MDNEENPLVMYLVVNKDLEMSVGKTAVQVAHAACHLTMTYYTGEGLGGSDLAAKKGLFKAWMKEGNYRKVSLEAHNKEFNQLVKEFEEDPFTCVVTDAGYTEIPAGSTTVLGIWPMRKNDAPKSIKRLQSLK